jgi:AcrR family transcriptional regulator
MGRPREFDRDEALDRAVRLFWRNGYAGTSLSDLTEALGITRPSLYAAFGNKETLFREVLDRYAAGPARFLKVALDAPTAYAVAEGLLRGAADLHADPGNPPGCLIVHGALVGDAASAPVREEMRRRRARLTEEIRERLERAHAEGDLPDASDCEALAHYVVAVMRGMAVEAASGATGAELHRIVDLAMAAWPMPDAAGGWARRTVGVDHVATVELDDAAEFHNSREA